MLLSDFDRYATAALVNLGFGAYFLGRHDEARHLASEGLASAKQRAGESGGASGNDLLELIEQRVLPPPAKSLPQHDSGREGSTLEHLVAHTTRLIRRWLGPTWRRKDQAGPERRGRA